LEEYISEGSNIFIFVRFHNYEYMFTTDPEARVRFPALPEKEIVGLERGPLSLVNTIEELLDRKVAAPV
jgi:hypothetical protein